MIGGPNIISPDEKKTSGSKTSKKKSTGGPKTLQNSNKKGEGGLNKANSMVGAPQS